ncbi:MAG: hypothetical protein Ct9H300mP12_15400 [Acidimicrobiales bacterium]|nr:MAG: hypothetical protein Ct9H300mP12_15400 [Acidimicrobiales bacterium]
MAVGNKHLGYKEALNAIEEQSPGSKHDFYFWVFWIAWPGPGFYGASERDGRDIGMCVRCEAPASGEVCAFCRLLERVGAPMLTITRSPPALVVRHRWYSGPPGLERSTV